MLEGITPEAIQQGPELLVEEPNVYIIDDAELKRVYDSYPVIWKKKESQAETMAHGLSSYEPGSIDAMDGEDRAGTKEAGKERVAIPTVFTAAPAVLKKFEETPYASGLERQGSYLLYLPADVYE